MALIPLKAEDLMVHNASFHYIRLCARREIAGLLESCRILRVLRLLQFSDRITRRLEFCGTFRFDQHCQFDPFYSCRDWRSCTKSLPPVHALPPRIIEIAGTLQFISFHGLNYEIPLLPDERMSQQIEFEFEMQIFLHSDFFQS